MSLDAYTSRRAIAAGSSGVRAFYWTSMPVATTEPIERDRRASVRCFRLRVTSGPDAGKEIQSTGDRVVIGTHPSAMFVLTDKTMSRFHCEIAIEDGRAVVRDLGSMNGTFVDGVSVLVAHLGDPATVALGSTQMLFELGDGEVTIEMHEGVRFGKLVGRSRAMRTAMALLARAAKSDVTVLLQGETGCGKDAAAESIHLESARRDKPFIVIDCASIPAQLMETELFGHEKGAFTGADRRRIGAFEAANTGTLVLDEIGELPRELQPKLLRVLESREVQRIGTNERVPVDVRVIAATNRNLRTEVNAQRFRPDLFFRIAVLEIGLPALRQHLEDLPLLVEHMLEGQADSPGAQALRTPKLIAELQRHQWPGNVRELRNYVEGCLALDSPPRLTANAPPTARVDVSKPWRLERERCMRELEREYFEKLLAAHGNNVSAAARAAGIDRIHMYRLLWRNGLRD
jgi:transcriptional regulator with PAS, ATPase and Fis domain